jgi:hypothetical protein
VHVDNEDDGPIFERMTFTPDDVLRGWVHQIRSYQLRAEADPSAISHSDPEALTANEHAAALIHDIWLRNLLRHPQSPVTVGWFAGCLSKILENEDPHLSLGLLKRPKGKPRDKHTASDVVWWVKLTEARGYSKSEAKSLAADVFAKEVKTIEAYLRTAGDWADNMNMDADWEEYFGLPTLDRPSRPLPPQKPGLD